MVFHKCKEVIATAGALFLFVFWETGFKNKDFTAVPLLLLVVLIALHDLAELLLKNYRPPGKTA